MCLEPPLDLSKSSLEALAVFRLEMSLRLDDFGVGLSQLLLETPDTLVGAFAQMPEQVAQCFEVLAVSL